MNANNTSASVKDPLTLTQLEQHICALLELHSTDVKKKKWNFLARVSTTTKSNSSTVKPAKT